MNIEQLIMNPKIILAVIAMIIFALIMLFIKKLKNKLSVKWVVISFLITFIVNLLLSFWGLDLFQENAGLLRFSYFASSILLGYLVLFLHSKGRFEELKWNQYTIFAITSFNLIVGYVTFSFFYNLLNSSLFGFWAGVHIIGIFIPFAFRHGYLSYISVPTKIYKVWYLDTNRPEPDFDKINVNKILLLAIEFIKNVNSSEFTNMRVKAPVDMLFCDWFQSFLLNYNEKYFESPIQFQYLDGTSMGWIFYYKNGFFSGKKFIDPDLTIRQNGLTEQFTIIAERVKLTYQY